MATNGRIVAEYGATRQMLNSFGMSLAKLTSIVEAERKARPLGNTCFSMTDLVTFSRDVLLESGIPVTLKFQAHVVVNTTEEANVVADEIHYSPLIDNATEASEHDLDEEDLIEYKKIIIPAATSLESGEWFDIFHNAKYAGQFLDVSQYPAVSSSAKKRTSLELFAGGGGLALGLEQAGFHSIGLVEVDKHCCATLKANRPKWNVYNGDVMELAKDPEFFKSISAGLAEAESSNLDVMTGGFPCQSFSAFGKMKGTDDLRGQMFMPFADLVGRFRPKVIVGENVKGLCTFDQGRILATILQEFAQHGYKMHWKLLDANDYGVPQHRVRLVIVGIRNDLAQLADYQYPEPLSEKPTLGQALENVPSSAAITYPVKKIAVFAHVKEGGNWSDVPSHILSEFSPGTKTFKKGHFQRLSRDSPCPTILTSPIVNLTERCHPLEDRPLTIRESARVQSFPDDWEFRGPTGSAYKQIGNAVPVNLAKMIGSSIMAYLDRIDETQVSE